MIIGVALLPIEKYACFLRKIERQLLFLSVETFNKN